MALRVLTSEEKESLKNDAAFISKCKWAVRDYAAYWSVHDGSGLNTEAARLKWAKDRLNSVQVLLNDVGDDSSLALNFCKVAKGMQLNLNAIPETTANIITALDAANKFEECASLYFDLLGENTNLSITGN